MDPTQRLPPELLLRMFDFFTHGDSPRDFIRGPGRVCARWRRLALAHPSFQKDIWLERDLGAPGLGLFQAQLAAGSGADIDLTIVHPEEIGPVLPLITENVHRCASLHIEYYGSPAEVQALLDALAMQSAPRLKRLHLHVEPVAEDDSDGYGDSTRGVLSFPSAIFGGVAPHLRRLELCGAICQMMTPALIPAFRAVDSLEVRVYDCGPHAVSAALTAAPGTRRLEVLAVKHGSGPWPPVILPPAVKLDKVMFSALDAAWDGLLDALDIYDVSEFAVLCGMPARYVSAYIRRSLSDGQPPLELSILDSDRLGVAHTDSVLSSSVLGKAVRLVDSLSTAPFAPYATRIGRLEVLSSEWPGPSVVRLPQLKTLVLHIMADRMRPGCAARCKVYCPKLRDMALLLGKRAPPEAFRVKADHVAYFVRDRLGLETAASQVAVSVARPLILIGRRSWLQATVGSITEV
ncbi:hypothetical protein AURDEDRAFT_154809 [Auricularia subglabra TFB-10046 SS5]|uniref:Uncharacterized protein n=1 Tax=Auricularia subglabra (strain TFB-10046 / SS5) TaxID=717982 RepID=J0WTG9_AURST|nr:hypothetical protein AURDEDRAFT_154809 [Auricularia subglabra TFB-10046 SS5]